MGGRAGQAGAHFSLIEENVAFASTPEAIHEGWMNSPHHRTNLLNPAVDRVGVAVVASRGMLYAVADYARSVPVLTQIQINERYQSNHSWILYSMLMKKSDRLQLKGLSDI